MADAMEALKGILGDGAENTIRNVMGSLTSAGGENGDGEDIKQAVEKLASNHSDPRTNLLLSLKPYMSESRRHSIDSVVKLLNFTKISGILKL